MAVSGYFYEPHGEPEKFPETAQEVLDDGSIRMTMQLESNAGTGKSPLLRHLHEAIPEAVFVAPTGAAARLIGGVTINSLFRIPPQPYITDWSMGVISNKGARKTIKAIKVLVVDESSLVRSDIFAAIDYRLRQYAPDGCAKYRYNKLVKGAVCGIPRVLDAGQCNDCYSLAVIA